MKLPLNMVQSDAERLESQRSCGECTACCVLPRIPIGEDPDFLAGKRGYTPCVYLRREGEEFKGCGCYENRPQLCRDYRCLWRAGIILGDERRRPDKLGLMFTFDEVDGQGVVEAWELWCGAAREHPGRGVIDAMVEHARVHIRFYGVPAAIQYRGPETLDLGRRLSEAALNYPQALAAWLDVRMTLDDLTTLHRKSVMLDLEPLRRGEPVQEYYRP